ncbi:GntR family transcriptional regulator [Brachybacterium sp. YJGR34]|uniref:GntR family transcriptional regulator n=1 Tax=Brachybacterium sp. YJGR34 TaxID=2059911 RepID=UPI000E0B3656|nr:GntR family transcriptional regulator [Brachybacterium sp. YJGR34]
MSTTGAVEGAADPAPRSRSEQARRALAGRIMDGTLRPGTPLRIAALSGELGMSATPVREALHLLTGERLVEYLPMRGFVVTQPPDDEQVRAMGEARLLLEPETAALAAERATAAEHQSLATVLARTAEAGVGARFREYEGYLQHSHAFHAEIATASRNPYLAAAVEAIPVHTLRFRRFGEAGVDDAEVSVAEHRRVLEALVAGDADGARAAMREHVRAVTQRALGG